MQPPFSMDFAFASGLGAHQLASRGAAQLKKLMGPRQREALDSKVAEFDRRCSPAACMPPTPLCPRCDAVFVGLPPLPSVTYSRRTLCACTICL